MYGSFEGTVQSEEIFEGGTPSDTWQELVVLTRLIMFSLGSQLSQHCHSFGNPLGTSARHHSSPRDEPPRNHDGQRLQEAHNHYHHLRKNHFKQ